MAVLALVVVVVAASVLAWLGSAWWVYRDARRRDVDSAVAWGVGTLFTGYFGLIAYIFVQGSSRKAALSGSTD